MEKVCQELIFQNQLYRLVSGMDQRLRGLGKKTDEGNQNQVRIPISHQSINRLGIGRHGHEGTQCFNQHQRSDEGLATKTPQSINTTEIVWRLVYQHRGRKRKIP